MNPGLTGSPEPNHLLKAPSPNTTALGLRASQYVFCVCVCGGGYTTQFVAEPAKDFRLQCDMMRFVFRKVALMRLEVVRLGVCACVCTCMHVCVCVCTSPSTRTGLDQPVVIRKDRKFRRHSFEKDFGSRSRKQSLAGCGDRVRRAARTGLPGSQLGDHGPQRPLEISGGAAGPRRRNGSVRRHVAEPRRHEHPSLELHRGERCPPLAANGVTREELRPPLLMSSL